MLYASRSLLFMPIRLRGFLSFNFGTNNNEYFSKNTECMWHTSAVTNPHTDTFSKKACKELFKSFKQISLRQASFSLTHLSFL